MNQLESGYPQPVDKGPDRENAAPTNGQANTHPAPDGTSEVSQAVSQTSGDRQSEPGTCLEAESSAGDRQSPSTPPEVWTPVFSGQRPPFAPGHELSLQHGAFSPRKVGPLAEELVSLLLADETLGYLAAPSYRPAIYAWARAEARVQLLEEYLGEQVEKLASDRVQIAYGLLLKFSSRAESGRRQLGLDPLSRARLGKDVAQGQAADAATMLTRAREQAERRARQEDLDHG